MSSRAREKKGKERNKIESLKALVELIQKVSTKGSCPPPSKGGGRGGGGGGVLEEEEEERSLFKDLKRRRRRRRGFICN